MPLPAPGAEALASLFERDTEIAPMFDPPLAAEELEAVVADIGLPVPDAFRALFRLCNGSAGSESIGAARYVLPDDGLLLLSLAKVKTWKTFWDDLARSYAATPESERQQVFHHAFWSKAWIPLAMGGMNDVYALATEPCFGGPAHQVVRFNTEGDTHWDLVSESLDDFLGMLATLLERRAGGLRARTLSELNPRARRIELVPATPDRFGREGDLLASKLYPDPLPRSPSLASLAAEAAETRGIAAQTILDGIVAAAQAALLPTFGDRPVEVALDADTGELKLWCVATVVDRVQSPGAELTVDEAAAVFGPCEIGDQMLVEVFYRPEDEAQAQSTAALHGELLHWDASWTACLDRWRAALHEIVAAGLRTGSALPYP